MCLAVRWISKGPTGPPEVGHLNDAWQMNSHDFHLEMFLGRCLIGHVFVSVLLLNGGLGRVPLIFDYCYSLGAISHL